AVPEYKVTWIEVGNYKIMEPGGDGLQPGPNDRNGVEFFIPAGAKGHIEAMKTTLPRADANQDVRLYAVGPHMHYVGTDMRINLSRPNPVSGEPAEECLIETPTWNFNWQRVYAYDAPIE